MRPSSVRLILTAGLGVGHFPGRDGGAVVDGRRDVLHGPVAGAVSGVRRSLREDFDALPCAKARKRPYPLVRYKGWTRTKVDLGPEPRGTTRANRPRVRGEEER
jgi:hypothetical protein